MSACGRRFVRCCWSEIVDRHRQSRKQQAEACMRLLDKRQEIGHACAETRADACKQESTHISRARARRSQSNSEKQDCCMLFLWPVGVQCNGFLLALAWKRSKLLCASNANGLLALWEMAGCMGTREHGSRERGRAGRRRKNIELPAATHRKNRTACTTKG